MLELETVLPNLAGVGHNGERIEIKPKDGSQWFVIFSYPADFTPVCSSEILEFAKLAPDFTKRNCQVVGISMDSSESHRRWISDLQRISRAPISFPLIADESGELLGSLKLLVSHRQNGVKKQRPSSSVVRGLYIVDPMLRIQFVQVMASSVGRSISEIMRVLDALQLSALRKSLGTPAEWRSGQDAVLLTDEHGDESNNERIQTMFSYLKFVPLDSIGFVKREAN